MQCSIEIKKFYFNTDYYITTPESLLEDLISLSNFNYYESYTFNCYVFHVDSELEKAEHILYAYGIPFKKLTF